MRCDGHAPCPSVHSWTQRLNLAARSGCPREFPLPSQANYCTVFQAGGWSTRRRNTSMRFVDVQSFQWLGTQELRAHKQDKQASELGFRKTSNSQDTKKYLGCGIWAQKLCYQLGALQMPVTLELAFGGVCWSSLARVAMWATIYSFIYQ